MPCAPNCEKAVKPSYGVISNHVGLAPSAYMANAFLVPLYITPPIIIRKAPKKNALNASLFFGKCFIAL